MTTSTAAGWQITGRFVLMTVLAFFTVVIGVNVVMIHYAVSTLPGTEVDSAYSASLAYEGEIKAARQQNARGWKIDAHIDRGADGSATLNVHARDAQGVALAGLTVSGRLERPTDRRADEAFDIAEGSGGHYRGTAQGVLPGQWELVIEADADGKRMFLSRNRIVLN